MKKENENDINPDDKKINQNGTTKDNQESKTEAETQTEQPSAEDKEGETLSKEIETEVNAAEKLQAETAELKDKLLRLYSDFENYKKRTFRERIELSKMAGVEVILALLPVLDDFERAIKSITTDTQVTDALKEGVNLIYTKFKTLLQQKGLEEMKTDGTVFDSDLHDAVTNAPAPSEDMKGKVVEELEKGYYLNGKVIRHAKVIVGN